MSRRSRKARSVNQLVSNEARLRRLTRDDGFVAYVMDRLLYRLGRSSQANEFYLKGGVLVANLLSESHRFTRDLDVLRRHGPPDPEDIRRRFEIVLAVRADDGIILGRVRVLRAEREVDDYDGVKVFVEASVEGQRVEVKVDIGFGDAVEPPVERRTLAPFLSDDPPAAVRAYPVEPVVAEKVQTVLSKFPVIAHRLKDVLDVVVLAQRLAFEGPVLVASLRATFERRGTRPDLAVLDDLRSTMRGRSWATDWSTMLRDKGVRGAPGLPDAVVQFDDFVRPILAMLSDESVEAAVAIWPPGGPWR